MHPVLVTVGYGGIKPELWTRITYVDNKNGVATMEIKIDNKTSVEIRLRRNSPSISDSEWSRFVKVDGKPKLRVVHLDPLITNRGRPELWISQVQMNYDLLVDVHSK